MTDGATRLSELRVAVMFLTRLPVGTLHDPVPPLSACKWAFPLVGVLVGVLVWCAHAAALAIGFPPSIAAVLGLVALVLITGALHFDGLADFADGIGGGRDKEHCLDIMRDSRIGSYGVIALIVAAALWITSLYELGCDTGGWMFVAVAVWSRFAMVLLLVALPSARPDGLGSMAASRQVSSLGVGAALSLFLIFMIGLPGLTAAIAMVAIAGLIGWKAHQRIGGQTGDVLGAAQLLCEVAGLAVLAVAFG